MKKLHAHKAVIIIILFTLLFPYIALAIDTITPLTPLTINQTLVSNGQSSFELGFFYNNNNAYLGIWYKHIENRTYVWVANRDAPLTSVSGTLTVGEDGNLRILDEVKKTVWSSGNHSVGVNRIVAQLLDSGNFVIRRENDENPSNYLWQSFEHPTDTLLPGMKLIGWNRNGKINCLQNWKSDDDPGSGDCTLKMSTTGYPEILMWRNGTEERYRSGAWNGRQLGSLPTTKITNTSVKDTSDEISYSFEMLNSSVYSRLILTASCRLKLFTWIDSSQDWSISWDLPRDQCDHYNNCGPYGICAATSSSVNCTCVKGFVPKNQQASGLGDGKDGCVRTSKLDCGTDGFLKFNNMKLPESSKVFVDRTMNLTTCGTICKRNCSCVAYANMDITQGGSGCVMWAVDLIDMTQYAHSEDAGQDLYIRAAASDLVSSSTRTNSSSSTTTNASGKGSGNHLVLIVTITVGVPAVIIFLVIILLLVRWKKTQLLKKSRINRKVKMWGLQDILMKEGDNVARKSDCSHKSATDEIDLPLFDFTTLAMATNNFSNENKLGHGGFGSVYKGVLGNGEVVAIKRLSRTSGQGIEELRNEVQLIARLQHRNLVRLLGCCIEVQEKLLVYEYMEHKSLNTFIFDKEKGAQLNWEKRFDIICGIARGLVYLHQDSRLMIIHRDLKTSNVLLDKEMKPKISDFGLARIFGSNQTEAETKKVVGTHGYMAPEYAMDGLFSIKSDVFSFGVLLLEIVSGKRNRGFYSTDNQLNLLGHTWKLWDEGNGLELLDESVGVVFSRDEVLRCIHIGLLCVQEQAEQRPNMGKVLLMLSSDVGQLPQPRNPGFNIGLRSSNVESPINHDESASINGVTLTTLVGR